MKSTAKASIGRSVGTILVIATIMTATPARAQDLIQDWTRIAPPAAPAVHRVTLPAKTTALLLLDFVSETCNATRRPRCPASIPHVARLLAAARAHHVTVIYSYVVGGTLADTAAALRPVAGEAAVQSGPDKFLHTDLAGLLRRDGIRTVIVTGTAAEGAVLATASEAGYRGYRVVLPYDGMSSKYPYAEQYVAWDLRHAPVLSMRTTLTSLAGIGFR